MKLRASGEAVNARELIEISRFSNHRIVNGDPLLPSNIRSGNTSFRPQRFASHFPANTGFRFSMKARRPSM
jgi:hypothetical protein